MASSSPSCRASGGANKDVDRIKGPWSPEEDEALQRLVARHGARNWSLISRSIPGRSGKSCRLRWCNQLSPQVEHRPFTPEEDDTILRAHAKFGNKWATIARLPLRPHRQRHQEPLELHPQAQHVYRPVPRAGGVVVLPASMASQSFLSAAAAAGSGSSNRAGDLPVALALPARPRPPLSVAIAIPIPAAPAPPTPPAHVQHHPIAPSQIPPPPPPTQQQPSLPFQLHTPPATSLAPPRPPQPPSPAPFSSEFLSMMQEMIRIEVRNYMSGSGFDPRSGSDGAAVRAATQRMMGMTKIDLARQGRNADHDDVPAATANLADVTCGDEE
ncbi:hypothetical protein EJB05_44276, partial [Eragrostis curvula]